MVNIKGLNKAEVLKVLFNASKVQGYNANKDLKPKDMSINEAQSIIESAGETLHFDYLNGKVMKVDITGDELNPWGYDRDNGQGAAQIAIDTLK